MEVVVEEAVPNKAEEEDDEEIKVPARKRLQLFSHHVFLAFYSSILVFRSAHAFRKKLHIVFAVHREEEDGLFRL